MAEEEHSKRFISESDIPLRQRKIAEEMDKKIQEEDLYNQYVLSKQSGKFTEAADYLVKVIAINNISEYREELRALYTSINGGDIDIGYLKVIDNNIEGAKYDFVLYLKSQNRIAEAVYWLIDDERISEAICLINLNDLNLIDEVLERIKCKNDDIANALQYVKDDFVGFNNMCNCVQPPRYIGLKYLFLHFGYALWRSYQLLGFIGLGIFPILLFIAFEFVLPSGLVSENGAGGIPALLLPIVCSMDIYRYHKWVIGLQHWKLMPKILEQHPQLIEVNAKFLSGQNQARVPIVLILAVLFWTFAIVLGIFSNQ